MYAVISDIHGNFAAFEQVIIDIRKQGIERILCLGDTIGYGPDPEACLSGVRDHCEMMLIGNHDIAVIYEPFGFNAAARDAALWTKTQCLPTFFSSFATRKNWQMLQNAPEKYEEGDFLFVHASPRDPVMEYIEESDTVDTGFGPSPKIVEIFDMIKGPCFVGHTHRSGIIDPAFTFHHLKDIDYRWRLTGEKCVVNVGSVGQPRDGDPRACYVTIDGEALRYHRVEYDIEATAKKIRAIPMLHDRLADRLITGQ